MQYTRAITYHTDTHFNTSEALMVHARQTEATGTSLGIPPELIIPVKLLP